MRIFGVSNVRTVFAKQKVLMFQSAMRIFGVSNSPPLAGFLMRYNAPDSRGSSDSPNSGGAAARAC